MSSSCASSTDRTDHRSRGRCFSNGHTKSNWCGINIAAMVLGFIVFWPIGLFILFWILSGRNVTELPQWLGQAWSNATRAWRDDNIQSNQRSDNVVFNEFQQAQYDRIRDIKDEIRNRARRFSEFRTNAKRRADEDEFNRFMADAPENGDA